MRPPTYQNSGPSLDLGGRYGCFYDSFDYFHDVVGTELNIGLADDHDGVSGGCGRSYTTILPK